jgi:hypothetical protein
MAILFPHFCLTQRFPNTWNPRTTWPTTFSYLLLRLTTAVTLQEHYSIWPTLLVTFCRLSYRTKRSRFSGRPSVVMMARSDTRYWSHKIMILHKAGGFVCSMRTWTYYLSFNLRIILNMRHFWKKITSTENIYIYKLPTPSIELSRSTSGPRATASETLVSTDRLKVGQYVRSHPFSHVYRQ